MNWLNFWKWARIAELSDIAPPPFFSLAWRHGAGVVGGRGADRLVRADGLALQLARDENGRLIVRERDR